MSTIFISNAHMHKEVKELSRFKILNENVEKKVREVGVYFLKLNNNVVYVGQSKNISFRILEHLRKIKNGFLFNDYEIRYCEESILDSTETFFIHYYNSKYNKTRYMIDTVANNQKRDYLKRKSQKLNLDY